jgi:hypothetical protein
MVVIPNDIIENTSLGKPIRILGPDEIIQEGDFYNAKSNTINGGWINTYNKQFIGKKVSEINQPIIFGRIYIALTIPTKPEFYIDGKPARYARTGDSDKGENIFINESYNIKELRWKKYTKGTGTAIKGYDAGHPQEGINPWFAILLEPEEPFTMEDYTRELLLEEEGKLE